MTNIVAVAMSALISITHTYALPNSTLTPGSIADTDVHVICSTTYDKDNRPNAQMSHSLKLLVMQLYNIPKDKIHTVEADALIPVGLGGDHFDTDNIWPQECTEWHGNRCVAGDAYYKDIKEVRARHTVCKLFKTDPIAAQSLLIEDQHQFATDWRKMP